MHAGPKFPVPIRFMARCLSQGDRTHLGLNWTPDGACPKQRSQVQSPPSSGPIRLADHPISRHHSLDQIVVNNVVYALRSGGVGRVTVGVVCE